MKNFLKKNKLPLVLLTCVIMLSVFYALSPSGVKDDDSVVSGSMASSNFYYFDEERLNILEERNVSIKQLETEVAAANTDISNISNKMRQIEEIYDITNKECSLELEIEALGYEDVLVHNYTEEENIGSSVIVNKCVDVKILATELKKERAVVITQLAKTKFGNNDYKVSIILETNNVAS